MTRTAVGGRAPSPEAEVLRECPAMAPAAYFGQGEREPYTHALQAAGPGTLTLRPGEAVTMPAGPVRVRRPKTGVTDASTTRAVAPPADPPGGRSSTSAAGRDGSWPPPWNARPGAPWASTPVAKRSARRAAAVPAPSNSQFSPPIPQSGHWQSVILLMATSASGEASPPCWTAAGSSLPRPGRYWWKWRPTTRSTPSTRPCSKTNAGTAARHSPGPGPAQRACVPGARRRLVCAAIQRLQGRVFCRSPRPPVAS